MDSPWPAVRVVYHRHYNIGLAGVERLHPFDSRKYGRAWKVLRGRFGRRLVYGGHIISIARALSFNGLANAFHILGLNGARHVAPSFAGDTIYAWSQVLDRAELPNRDDIGALRLRTFAVKDRDCADLPGLKPDGSHEDGVVLDMDYWVAVPR